MSKARTFHISFARDDVGNLPSGVALTIGCKGSKCYKKQIYSSIDEMLLDNPDYAETIKKYFLMTGDKNMSKLSYEVVSYEKGCNGYNKNYPIFTPCKTKQQAIATAKRLKLNPAFECVYVKVDNGEEIIDLNVF